MSPLGRIRQQVDGTTVVELDGDADLGALPQLQQVLARAIDTAKTVVVVDLDGTTVLDDAALGLIVGAAAAGRRRGIELRLICSDARRRARLADTRLDEIIPVDDSTTARVARTTTARPTGRGHTGGVEPYTAVIFTNRRTDHDDAGYAEMAAEMERLAALQPGYLGIESVRAADGTGITVSYWTDAEAASAWKQQTAHLGAQRLGRERWYDEYRVRIATVEREYASIRPIFHLAVPDDWAAARRTGIYPLSTRGLTFEQQGFVHCSFVEQMEGVANRFYADLDELIVVHLDRAALADTLRIEPASDLVDELFPHLYAPLTTNAVTTTTTWRRDGDVWVDPPVTTDRPATESEG